MNKDASWLTTLIFTTDWFAKLSRDAKKEEENQKNSIKHGFYEGFVSKQYGFCFQMPIDAFIYILKHLSEANHDRTKKRSMKCKEKYSNFK
jgi:hypothetical protein